MKHSKLTQRGDTITLNMTIPTNFKFEDDRFNYQTKHDDTGIIQYQYREIKDRYRKENFGISKLNIINDQLEIGISGKILGDSYVEGITLDTIPSVIDVINEVGGMNITADGILTKSVMRTFDNTFNIQLDEKDCIDDYIESLDFGIIGNTKLGLTGYTKESLVLTLDTKVKNRMIFYNKELELRTNSKDFAKKFNIIDDFKDTLRVELNNTSQDKMRQNYGLGNNKVRLIDILSSRVNAIDKNFARFVDKKASEKLLFDYDTLFDMEIKNKPQLHEKFFLEEHFRKFKGNLNKVLKMYEGLYTDGKVPYREKSKIRTYYKNWTLKQSNLSDESRLLHTRKFKEIVSKIQSLS
jgi:hypothetical protein